MNLHTPPTDSLYKFMAISGCFIVIVSIYWSFMLLNDLSKQKNELTIQLKPLEAEVEWLKTDMDSFRERMNNLVGEMESFSSKQESLLEVMEKEHEKGILNQKKIEAWKETNKEKQEDFQIKEKSLRIADQKIMENSKEIKIKTAKINALMENLNNTAFRGYFIIFISTILSLFGFILATIGFKLWYKKIQFYQDCILKNTACSNCETPNMNR